MKALFVLGILFMLHLDGQSQNQGRILYTSVIDYSKDVKQGGAQDKAPIEYQSTLFLNGSQSLFILSQSPEGSTLKDRPDGGFEISISDKYGFSYFKDIQSKILVSREFILNKPFILQEGIEDINWAIGNEQKKIGNLLCQKATCFYKGRNFIAWFSKEIPVSAGPWKLWGLPGLIVEAYDEQEVVKFSAKSIDFPFALSEPVAPPTQGDKISRVEFEKLWTKKAAQLKQFLSSSIPAGNTEVGVTLQRIEKAE